MRVNNRFGMFTCLSGALNNACGIALDENAERACSSVQLPDAYFLCLLPKTRRKSELLACLKLPVCLFLQRSSKSARSAANVLTKDMSKMCVTCEA